MRVLVTGGSRGIGKACVELFSREGHEVIFFYRSSHTAAMELEAATGAKAVMCDVGSADDVRGAMTEAGDVDVLINNAGVSRFNLFDNISDSEWREVIDTNLSGAFYVSREAARSMIAKKRGRIINVGSMWGKTGASCEVHYSASKAGLRGMTMALAKELGPSGITVNCIEPGVIDTEMNAHLSPDDVRSLCHDTPLGRLGTPMEVAHLAYFLASDKAAFITGQIIGIDGGFAV